MPPLRKIRSEGRIRRGRLVLVNRSRLAADIRRMSDGPVLVTIAAPESMRSIQANRYYFGRVVRTIGDELGYADPEDAHEAIAFKFLRVEDDPITGSPRRRRTRDMTSSEFSDYVTRVITWAETEMEIRIPRPGEDE